MKIFSIVLLTLLPVLAFSQKEIAYKTLNESSYHTGDKIAAGSLMTLPVKGKYRKYTVEFTKDLPAIRQFTFDHPNFEYQIVVVWRQLGRKFPSQTIAVTDSLEHFFRKDASTHDNRQYINQVDHLYVKKLDQPYLYLEIISENSPVLAQGKNALIVSGEPVLYKHYNNIVKVDTSAIPEADPIYLELPGSYIQRKSHGTFLLKPRNKVDEKRIHVKSGITTKRFSQGVYWFKFEKLPSPELFLNDRQLTDSTVSVSEIRKGVFAAKYVDSQLRPAFIVAEVDYLINGKVVKQTGNKVNKTVLKALKEFRDEDKVVIRKIVVNGPGRYKLYPGKKEQD